MFANVSWGRWLALMIPYSAFFFLIDSLVVWRIVNWFNTRVRYVDILPIRGSTYTCWFLITAPCVAAGALLNAPPLLAAFCAGLS